MPIPVSPPKSLIWCCRSAEKVDLSGKAKIFFRPYAAPVEQPDDNYNLWLCTGRVLEHWHSGSMLRRVPELHRTVPSAMLYMHPRDAEAHGLKRKDVAWIESRRGKIKPWLKRMVGVIVCHAVRCLCLGSMKACSSTS